MSEDNGSLRALITAVGLVVLSLVAPANSQRLVLAGAGHSQIQNRPLPAMQPRIARPRTTRSKMWRGHPKRGMLQNRNLGGWQ